jgi:hypothetical protein
VFGHPSCSWSPLLHSRYLFCLGLQATILAWSIGRKGALWPHKFPWEVLHLLWEEMDKPKS